ncbi:MAG TPA: hypothetical protein P5543_04875 [Planctomycetota bacterium]|nr:hypothetical protein [Planctomycetota bacterium]HRU51505.1 hypothetical protein [Planctomycetota bacterium]
MVLLCILIIIFCTSCVSTTNTTEDRIIAHENIDSILPRAKTAKQKENNPEWEEELLFWEDEIDRTAQKIHAIFTIDALSLAESSDETICVALLRNEMQQLIAVLYQSQKGQIPHGRELQRTLVSDLVTIKERQRFFWITPKRTIEFTETDKIFRSIDKNQEADLILYPLNLQIPRQGMLDIIKDTLQIHIYTVHLDQ